MSGAADLVSRLAEPSPLLLDGATGTELERRGAPASLPLWSAHALVRCPELVAAIHADYVAAGADLITANSFRTQRRTLARGGLGERAAELTGRAVALARGAALSAPRRVFVLGSAPPLEDCFRPDRVPDDAALAREQSEHLENLAAAGVDGVLIETMNTSREARACARAARQLGLPAIVCFVCGDRARLLSGEPLADALAALRAEAPLLCGVNCVPPSRVASCLEVLRRAAEPFALYPNLGEPLDASGSRRSEELDAASFAASADAWLEAGARVVGGCCGTTPAHVRALATRLRR
jgi:S-methylmethionine-dependent homocysteine/selenocysteine methylase